MNFNHSLSFWRLNEPENRNLELPKTISNRLTKLIDSNLLPDIKRAQNDDIIIRKGILVELYRCGVTRDQLPNLRALNDYLGLPPENFKKSHGNKVVTCTGSQLSDYFDKIEVVEE